MAEDMRELSFKFVRMSASEIKHIITNDGSSTLYSPQYDEHYHSVHGAIQESMHVFIRMGLDALSAELQEVNVLEMGLGTGLNALLTLLYRKERQIIYTGLEAIPVSVPIVEALNYPDQLGEPALRTPFMALHEASWEETHLILPRIYPTQTACQTGGFPAGYSI